MSADSVDLGKMKEYFDNSAFAKFMGMSLTELSPGFARVQFTVKSEFLNWDGRIQGGVMTCVMDQAFGNAINSLGRIYMAVQLSINIISTATAGDIITATSKATHAGKSLGVCEMSLHNQQGKLIATGLGTAIGMGMRE